MGVKIEESSGGVSNSYVLVLEESLSYGDGSTAPAGRLHCGVRNLGRRYA